METHQTRKQFSSLLLSDFGEPTQIVDSVLRWQKWHLVKSICWAGVVFCHISPSASMFDVLSTLTGQFFFFRPFSENPGGWLSGEIPVDQQSLKYSNQSIWLLPYSQGVIHSQSAWLICQSFTQNTIPVTILKDLYLFLRLSWGSLRGTCVNHYATEPLETTVQHSKSLKSPFLPILMLVLNLSRCPWPRVM